MSVTAAELGLASIVLPGGQEIWIRKASFASQARAVTPITDQVRALQGNLSMGPGEPRVAAHPEELEPRRWQYQPGLNLQTQPRATEATSFAMLRAIADNYDVARLCIERRKDELRGLAWHIAPKVIQGQKREEAKARAASLEGAIDEATEFFKRPNREDFWAIWLTQWLEDLFVIDAPTVFRRRRRDGGLFAAEVIDGSTIRPLIDDYGRLPQPPEAAYAQVLYGTTWGAGEATPSTGFTIDELLYTPYWQRTYSHYGHPPAEWVMLAVNRALRRQSIDLSLYTEGTLPVAFYKVPEGWSGQQLAELQDIFDGLLAGNDVARSRTRFVPGGPGTGLEQVHPEPKTEVEEWLMYVTCAAYGVMPTELGFQPRGSGLGGKGFADQQSDSTMRRSTRPLADHVAGICNVVLTDWMEQPELEFVWEGLDKPEDIVARAQADKLYVDMGKVSVDELRERDDQDPIGLGQYVASAGTLKLVDDILNPPDPVVPVDPETGAPLQMPFGMTGAAGPQPPAARPKADEDEPDPDDEGVDDVAKASAAADLGAWQRKALKAVRAGRPAAVPFESAAIAEPTRSFLAETLAKASTAGEVRAAFTLAKAGASAGPFGPAPTPEPPSGGSGLDGSASRASTWSARSVYRRSPFPTSTPGMTSSGRPAS